MKNKLLMNAMVAFAFALVATIAKAGLPAPDGGVTLDPDCMNIIVNVYGDVGSDNSRGEEMASIIELDGTNVCGAAKGMVINRRPTTIALALKRDKERPVTSSGEYIAAIKFMKDGHAQKFRFTVDKSGIATMKTLLIANRKK